MKKKKIAILYFFVLHCNPIFAQKYILRSQNIHQKDNDNDDFFDNNDLLHLDQVVEKITKLRNRIYKYGIFIKRSKYYNNIIISMSKYYLKQLKKCSNDEEKRKIITEYQSELHRIKKNRDSKNLFQIIGFEEEEVDIDITLLKLKNKLYKNGFFDAVIETKKHNEGGDIFVDFLIQKEKRYTINDYTIDKIVDLLQDSHESFIRIGEGYKEKNFIKERTRVYELLRNSGYVFFKNQYINFFITKDEENKTLDVDLTFLTEDENNLKPFNFDTINIKLENGKNINKAHPYKDVFYFNTGRYGKKILYRFIPFKKGQLYTLQKENVLIRKMLQTEVFSNVYVSHELNEQGKLLSTIHLIPEKKIKTGTDIGIDIKTKLNDSNDEILKPYASQKLFIKNFFRSLETIEFSASFLGNVSYDRRLLFTPMLQLDLLVSFPYFFPFLLLRDKTNENLQVKTEFHIKLKNIFKNSDFLLYFASGPVPLQNIGLHNLSLKCVYNALYKNHSLDLIIVPSKLSTYQNKTLNKPDSYLLTKVKLHYTWNFEDNQKLNTSFLDHIFEFGLCRLNGNYVSNLDENFTNKYIKNVFTLKKIFKLPNKWKFANRAILGDIYIFKNSSNFQYRDIPPKIYFSAGGRTTVRGFDFESIGPGRSRWRGKRKGEVLIVFNYELRKKITKIIEFAVFIDIGNTWKVRTNNEKEKFNFKFLDDLYTGVGAGIRLNFKLVILSFDLGIPTRSPIRKPYKDFVFHFGVNYSF